MKEVLSRALIIGFAFLAAIAISAATGQDGAGKVLKVKGAVMASNQVDRWGTRVVKEAPGVAVTVSGSSTGKGFVSLLDGTADIAMMSREVLPDERNRAEEKGIKIAERPVGYAGVALITSSRNPVSELTMDQLKRLFSGEYDNWRLVGGPDEPVRCLSRRVPESGGAVFFRKRVLGEKPFGSKTVFTETWHSIIRVCSVARDLPVGIVPHGRDLTGVKVLRIKRDAASVAVAPTQENIRSKEYPIVLSFSLVWNAQSKDPSVKAFVDFCASEHGAK